MRRFLLLLIAAGLCAGIAAPADAAWTTIGSKLRERATIAHSDPNDIVFWPTRTPGAIRGINVPLKGQAIRMRVKGGVAMTRSQYRRAKAMDPNFDIFHFVVLRPQPDGSWKAAWSSQSLRMPLIGNARSSNKITTFKAGGNNPLCVLPGDRISVATVGGFTPGLFEQGLPYRIFGRAPGAESVQYRHAVDATRERFGGKIQLIESHPQAPGNPATRIFGTETHANEELLLQVRLGTGRHARFTCGGTAPTTTNGRPTEAGNIPLRGRR